jgi:hypothetical protein
VILGVAFTGAAYWWGSYLIAKVFVSAVADGFGQMFSPF